MLKRFQNYMQDNPLQAWLILVALPLPFYLAFLCSTTRPVNPGLVVLYASLTLSPPTRLLVLRFSEEQRRKHPISSRQETAVGVLSLVASLCSICALSAVAFSKRLGTLLTTEMSIRLLMLFSGSVLLALALGYAARNSTVGGWGLRLSFGWLLFVVFTAAGLLLRHL